MLIDNLPVLLRLTRDRKTRRFLKEVDLLFKNDKLYSKWKILKIFFKILSQDKLIYKNGMYYLNFTVPCIPHKAVFTFIDSALDKTQPFSSIAYCQKTAPITICLTITKKCNYNCYYCGAKDKDKQDISTAAWRKIITDLQVMNTPVIFFTGGEPLLRDDLEKLCACVSNKSLLYILTSGAGLTLAKAKRLQARGVFGLGISLTAFGKEHDRQLRGNTHSYDNAVAAIKNSVTAGLFTTVISVMPKNKLDKAGVFAFLRFMAKLGVSEVILKEPVKTGALLNADAAGDIYYTTDADKKLLTDMQKKANRHFKTLKVSVESLYASQSMFGCAAGLNHSAINAAGELTPCDFCPVSFGNVLNTPVSELFREMSQAIAVPGKTCMQMEIYKEQLNREVPLNKDLTLAIMQKRARNEFPQLFQHMHKTKRS